ncbi:hypothetical protein CT0861_04055 [Colletotrichum tofieldiae]|uniref:Uncharacterized protein n=1 Tax=Colletotrichum tofieldiae TaxID=708197 RepID=A0A161Y5M2_9PEZI|nr:hypothetical protein CT0861_04055 [Colletotrichum tofieldiae]
MALAQTRCFTSFVSASVCPTTANWKSKSQKSKEASAYSRLCSDPALANRHLPQVDAFQPNVAKGLGCVRLCIENEEGFRKDDSHRAEVPLGMISQEGRPTTEALRGFGLISPLVSQVVMMAILLLLVVSRQGRALQEDAFLSPVPTNSRSDK